MTIPQDLLEAARNVWKNAYAPYSGFQVGAALRSGEAIFQGANIENASYGLARCAEQSAIQAMASQGKRSFSEILIYTEAEEPASPCGACRQVLFEFNPDATVYLLNHQSKSKVFKVKDLLPYGFSLKVK